ncbi:SULTR2 [Scenedesmus sp. PABB004]|nr:SULTR2 [Scenedesmus sp. PABB004]
MALRAAQPQLGLASRRATPRAVGRVARPSAAPCPAVGAGRRWPARLRAAAPEAPEVDAPLEIPTTEESTKPFPYELPLDPNTKALASVPLPLFYPGVLALAAVAGLAGATVGRGLPVSPEAKPITAALVGAALGAGALYAGYQAKQKRDGAAVIDLYNYIVELDDPTELTLDAVAAVGSRYGIDMHKSQLEGLQKIYGQYLETIIPTGDAQLTGDEAAKVRLFKDVLGLADEDAAPVHIEVGRRLSRIGFEYKDRTAQFEQRKAFQRLVYLSYIVFGDQKAAFLLPWRRVFNLTDAQLFVARRDNARAIFTGHLAARGGDFPAERQFLRELRDYQTAIKLFDESAEEAVRAAMRGVVEASLARAVEITRAPGKARDPAAIVEALGHVLDYSRKMARLANDDDLVPGLGLPTIHGGPWDVETRRRDGVRRGGGVARGGLTPAIDADLKELAVILCLGAKEAGEVRSNIAGALYKRLLREAVTTRRIDEAASPAQVLGELVERSGYSPQAAAELHKSLYRTKLGQLVAKKKLTPEEQEELKRIRRILCIPGDAAAQVLRGTAGRVLEEVLADIYLMGAKPVGEYEAERVDATVRDLALDRSVALDVLKDVTRQRFKAYVQQAQKERDRRSAAQVLKKLVQFNALVVTPILEKVKGAGNEAAKKELADLLVQAAEKAKQEEAAEAAAKAKEAGEAAPAGAEASSSGADAGAAESSSSSSSSAPEGEQPKELQVKAEEGAAESVKKMIAAQRGEFGDEERKGQKEITLGDDLEPPVRAELYKNYLMYSMSGDVVELPVGGVIRKKSSLVTRQAEMARLQQLGDLLGMGMPEVAAVHNDLAEQAYRSQAQDVLRGSGSLSEERKTYLEELRAQLNIGKEAADKIIREVRTEVLGAAAALEGEERWTIDKVLGMHKEGVSIPKMLEEPQRRMLLRKEIDRRLNDGKGEFDADLLLRELPAVLDIEDRRVRMLIKELVGARKRMLLVQAVSQHRQRRPGDAVTSLLNLVSAYRAAPEESAPGAGSVGVVQWGEREELKDLYGIFAAKVADAAKREELAGLFGLSPEDTADILASSGKTADKLRVEAEEEAAPRCASAHPAPRSLGLDGAMERTFENVDSKACGSKANSRRVSSVGGAGPEYSAPLDFPWPHPPTSRGGAPWSGREEIDAIKGWLAGRRTRRARQKRSAWGYASALLPCLQWLRGYNLKSWLLFDILAGIAVGFTVVPQVRARRPPPRSTRARHRRWAAATDEAAAARCRPLPRAAHGQGMSYANIAGVPAVMGLYGAFTPVLIYSLFGSSRQLGVGPVAVTSGLIFSGMAGVVPGYDAITDPNDPGPELAAVQAEYNRNVIQLAFLVACLYTAVGLFRLGFLIRFLSHPVITGFTSGAALVIATGQVKYILGVSYKKQDTLQGELSNIIAQLSAGKFKYQEFLMGMAMLGFLISLKYIQRKWPRTLFLKALGPFIACVVGIAVVAGFGWGNGKGPIKIVKTIPSGLPPVSIGLWAPISNLGKLLPLAFIVMAVDMLESTSIARALARKNGYELNYNQEITGLGLANFAGAIIIIGVSQLVEVGVAIELFKLHLRDFIVWLCAFAVTTFAGVELGLMSSIALSLVILVLEASFPHTAVLGRIGKTNVSVSKYEGAETTPGIVVVRLDAPLFFANTVHFESAITHYLADGDDAAREAGLSGVKFLVLDLTPVTRSDSSGAHMLRDLATECTERGVQLVLCNPNDKLVSMLERIAIYDVLPRAWVFVHTHDGVRAAAAALHGGELGGLAGAALPRDGADLGKDVDMVLLPRASKDGRERRADPCRAAARDNHTRPPPRPARSSCRSGGMERTFEHVDSRTPSIRRPSVTAPDYGPPLDFPFPHPQGGAAPWSGREEIESIKGVLAGRKTRRARQKRGAWGYASALLPCLQWLRGYNLKSWLLFDILAGIAVGFTVVPQVRAGRPPPRSTRARHRRWAAATDEAAAARCRPLPRAAHGQGMSYANIAGVPAVMGLYGAFTPVLIYSLFGSSRQLGVGPVAVTSGLIFSGMAGVVPGYDAITDPNDPGPELAAAEYNRNVIQLAFLVACLYTAVGLFRLGFLIRFLSHPVITGFTSGAALVIATGQVKYLLGVSYKKQDTLQGELSNIIAQLSAGKFKYQEFLMGMAMLGFLISLKYIQRKWPRTLFLKALGPFIACVVGIAVVAGFGWGNGKGPIKIVKTIPSGLPPVSIGLWAPISNLGKLLPLAFIVMAVDMLESTSIARALARKNGYELNYNQEITGLGLANFAGAIIIIGVSQLVEVGVAIELFKLHLRDFIVWLCAFAVTTFAGVELGLMSSIALSLVILVLEASFPHTAVLGRIGKTNVSVSKYEGAETTPGIVVVRLDAPLFFANTVHFESAITHYLADGDDAAREAGLSGVKFLVLDLTPVTRSDSSGAHMLRDLATECTERGVQLVLCNPNDKLVSMLERIAIYDVLPRAWVFVHTHDGVRAAAAALHGGELGGLAGAALPHDSKDSNGKDVDMVLLPRASKDGRE